MPAKHESASDEPEEPSPTGQRWRVLKFGGTSVSSAARWQSIQQVARARIDDGARVLLVCSAVAGVTDMLARLVASRRADEAVEPLLAALRDRHIALGEELGIDAAALLDADLASLSALLATAPDNRAEAEIMGHGERLSTRLGAAWLEAQGVGTTWVDARELLTSIPLAPKRAEHYLSASCECAPSAAIRARLDGEGTPVIITQGFVARDPDGETVLLGRGGSDTSAAYLACVIAAERLEIWTDVPGLFTANPSVVPDARLLERVGYREAQAMGALGASVLHPRAIEAVWEHGIPVELGWTQRPDFDGTCINASRGGRGVKAISSRSGLAMFALRRPPSWQPVGFLADVAACFAKRGLSLDLVSSSCSEIRVTVDLAAFPSAEDEIPSLLEELKTICEPRVVKPVASVSVIGEGVSTALLSSDNAFEFLIDEALFMVVHAANEHHVSFVLDEQSAEQFMRSVHEHLLSDHEHHTMGPTWKELTEPTPPSSRGAA